MRLIPAQFVKPLDEKAAANSESERAVRRTRLISLATQPIAAQIEKLGPPDAWCQQYRNFAIPNKKVDQIVALEGLQQWLWKQRIQSEQALSRTVRFTDFPVSKPRPWLTMLQSRVTADFWLARMWG